MHHCKLIYMFKKQQEEVNIMMVLPPLLNNPCQE